MTANVSTTGSGRSDFLSAYHDILDKHAAFKRFNERWVADPTFRQSLAEDTAGTLARYAIPCSAEDVRSTLEADVADPSPAMRAMWQIVVAKSRWTHHFYSTVAQPTDARIRAWRERQAARQLLELGPFYVKSNIHASLAIELTKGCSVGCWFCALSPGRLTGAFAYNDANRRLWLNVLGVLDDCLGPAVKTGFLYWASDPFDNPDYERFCLDFHDVLCVFPPTTTALALRDPARTRAFLQLSGDRGCWLNRFSIVTLRALDALHAEFTADELAHVECLPVNRESAFAFGNAGRFRERAKSNPELMERQWRNLRWAPWYTGDPAYADSDDYPVASIGCVSGFLINMVDRSVQLISPCSADDRWPEGSLILDEGTFDDELALASEVNRMIGEHMSPIVRPEERLRFHPWLRLDHGKDGFRLGGRFRTERAFGGDTLGRVWCHLAGLVERGDMRARDVTLAVSTRHEVGTETVQSMLNELLAAGVLDELHR